MWFLAAVASFLFPGAGQAIAGRLRPAVIWAVAGMLPVAIALWWPPIALVLVAYRIGCAVNAALVVAKARPGTTHVDVAAIVAGVQLGLLVAIRFLVLQSFAIPASSMTPTLLIGDSVFVDKLTPRITGYHRGEIVVFVHPSGIAYVKRIAAVAGDTIAVRQGVLVVNDHPAPRVELDEVAYDDYIDDREGWVSRSGIAFTETLDGHSYQVLHEPPRSDGSWPHDYPALDADPHDPCGGAVQFETQHGGYQPVSLHLTADSRACTVPPGTLFMLGDSRDNSNDSRSWGAVPVDQITGRVAGIWWSSGREGIRFSRLGRVD